MLKYDAVSCMRMFVEKKVMLLHYQHDHCSSGSVINKDLDSL